MLDIIECAEDNAFMRRRKISARNTFSTMRSETIEEANILSVFLFSIDRVEEAYRLLKSYAEEIPFNEHRWQCWEATCQGLLFLAYLESLKENDEESLRLTNIVYEQDYERGRDDKLELFWATLGGHHMILDLIELQEPTQNDSCSIYAEQLLHFIYFQQLIPLFGGFGETEKRILRSNVSDLKSRLLLKLCAKSSRSSPVGVCDLLQWSPNQGVSARKLRRQR